MRTIVAAALAAAFGFGMLTAPDASARAVDALPPCEAEDASYGPLPCQWDAHSRGNGQGDSFVAHAGYGPGDVCYRYADPRRDACYRGVRDPRGQATAHVAGGAR